MFKDLLSKWRRKRAIRAFAHRRIDGFELWKRTGILVPISGGAEVFTIGETKIRPGTYYRITNRGGGPPVALPQGIVAAIFQAPWGPVNVPTILTGEGDVTQNFGTGAKTDIGRLAFRGGAREVVAVRPGTGGVVATHTLTAGAVQKVRLDGKYPGTRANGFTVTKRVNLSDATKNDLVVFENTTLLETITYTPGADDATALATAVNANSKYLVATVLAVGAVDTVSQVAFAGGTDPTVDGAAYTAALAALEPEYFNVLAVGTEDASIQASVTAFITRLRTQGRLIMGTIGEPTSVALATRQANAAAQNAPGTVYVLNGFQIAGTNYEGSNAAAMAAGMIASADLTNSLTHSGVPGASDLVGPLTNAQIETSIQSGALVFTKNASRQVVIEYGITTLVNLPANIDAGWKKIRRVRTRDALMGQILADTDAIVGKVNNDPDGRALVIAAAQGAINRLVAAGVLLSGTAFLDPATPPEGDSAYFGYEVDDIDSLEKIYETFAFEFSAPASA